MLPCTLSRAARRPYFGFEIFKQETTNAVMAAMLMHDALNTASPKNPGNKAKCAIDNSLELFRTQGVHGGLWRSAYTIDSLGEVMAAQLTEPHPH